MKLGDLDAELKEYAKQMVLTENSVEYQRARATAYAIEVNALNAEAEVVEAMLDEAVGLLRQARLFLQSDSRQVGSVAYRVNAFLARIDKKGE